MKDTLYRITPTMKVEEPELSGSVMIMSNGGTFFAELHPVRIKAKAKEPCRLCTAKVVIHADTPSQHAYTCRPRYCFNCGRRLLNEEAQP